MNNDAPEYLTQTVHQVSEGNREAIAKLLPLVYQELRALAADFLQQERPDHTPQPTALVREAFIRISDKPGGPWKNDRHFFEVAAKVMRHVLIDSARARLAQKRGGQWQRVTISQAVSLTSSAELDPLALEQALAKLEILHERQGRIVELRFMAGLSTDRIAEILGLSRRTIELDWRTAKAFLRRELQNRG